MDSIVNAANNSLLGGGGVDGAIHRAAGANLKEECRTLNGCETGYAKITGGYQLPAKCNALIGKSLNFIYFTICIADVIHTVGPVGEKPGLLQMCYKNCLEIMLSKKLRTIAFPCISTGIYGYPIEPAAHVAVYEVRQHLEKNKEAVDRVIFCVFDENDERMYQGVLQSYFPLN